MSDDKEHQPSRTALAVEMVMAGSSCCAAARTIGVDVSSVLRACKRRGVHVGPRGSQLSTDGVPVRAAEMVANGASYSDTARTLGVSVKSVMSACTRRGVSSRHRAGGRINDACSSARAARMVENGSSLTAAAKACGVTVGSVSRACKVRGIVSRYSRKIAEKRA